MSSTPYMDGVEVLQRDEDERECGLLFFFSNTFGWNESCCDYRLHHTF